MYKLLLVLICFASFIYGEFALDLIGFVHKDEDLESFKAYNGDDIYRAYRVKLKNKFVVRNYVWENRPYISIENGGSESIRCYLHSFNHPSTDERSDVEVTFNMQFSDRSENVVSSVNSRGGCDYINADTGLKAKQTGRPPASLRNGAKVYFSQMDVDLPLEQQVYVKTEIGDLHDPRYYIDPYTINKVEGLDMQMNPWLGVDTYTKLKIDFSVNPGIGAHNYAQNRILIESDNNSYFIRLHDDPYNHSASYRTVGQRSIVINLNDNGENEAVATLLDVNDRDRPVMKNIKEGSYNIRFKYENMYKIGISKHWFHHDYTKSATEGIQDEFIYSDDYNFNLFPFEYYGDCNDLVCVNKFTQLINTHWQTVNSPTGFEFSYTLGDRSFEGPEEYAITLTLNNPGHVSDGFFIKVVLEDEYLTQGAHTVRITDFFLNWDTYDTRGALEFAIGKNNVRGVKQVKSPEGGWTSTNKRYYGDFTVKFGWESSNHDLPITFKRYAGNTDTPLLYRRVTYSNPWLLYTADIKKAIKPNSLKIKLHAYNGALLEEYTWSPSEIGVYDLKVHAFDANLNPTGYLVSRTNSDNRWASFGRITTRDIVYNVEYQDTDGNYYLILTNIQLYIDQCILCRAQNTLNSKTKNDITYTETMDFEFTFAPDVEVSNVQYQAMSNTRNVANNGGKGFITIDIPNPAASISVNLLQMSSSTGVGSIKHYDAGVDYVGNIYNPIDDPRNPFMVGRPLTTWPWTGYHYSGSCFFTYEFQGEKFTYSQYIKCPQYRYTNKEQLKTVIGPQSIDLSVGNEKEIDTDDILVTPRLRRAIPLSTIIKKKNKPRPTEQEVAAVAKKYEAVVRQSVHLAGAAAADWTPAKRGAFRRALRAAIRRNARRNIDIDMDQIIIESVTKVNGGRRLLNDPDQVTYSVTFSSDNDDEVAAFVESATDDNDIATLLDEELQSEADFDENNDIDFASQPATTSTDSTDVIINNYYDADDVCQWVSTDL